MDLWILRHSLAEDRSPSGADADRPLTPEGRARARRVGEGIARLGARIDRALSSPYTRAHETATIVLDALGLSASTAIQPVPALEPGGVPEAAVRAAEAAVAGIAQPRGVLLVSHQPLVGSLIERLLGGSNAYLALEPGTVAWVRVRAFSPRLPGELVMLAPASVWGG